MVSQRRKQARVILLKGHESPEACPHRGGRMRKKLGGKEEWVAGKAPQMNFKHADTPRRKPLHCLKKEEENLHYRTRMQMLIERG